MDFYASPPPSDRKCFTLDSTGYARMRPPPVRFRREKGWRSHQFMYTLRGEGVGDVAGAPFHVRPHAVTLLPPDRNHGYEPAPGCGLWEYRWVEFGGEIAPAFLEAFGLRERWAVDGCADAWPFVEEVVTTLETGGNAALHEAAALFLRVLAIVERCARRDRPRPVTATTLDLAAKRFMNDHLEEPIALTEVARAVRASPHHLVRVFRRNNGMTPMAYLRQVRAEYAKSLLLRGDLNISEVGQRVGYPVLQHFSRMFRMQTGTSPRAFLRARRRATPSS
jgi:AraC-like DNA-binding protein